MIKDIDSSKEYLTTTEASKVCNVTRFTIRNWVNSGKLKSYKTAGGHRRIHLADLIKFVELNGITELKDQNEQQDKPQAPIEPCTDQTPSEQLKHKRGKCSLHRGMFLSGKYVASVKNLLIKKKKKDSPPPNS